MEQSWAGDGLGVGGGYSLLYGVFKVSGGRAGGIPAIPEDPCEQGGESHGSVPPGDKGGLAARG